MAYIAGICAVFLYLLISLFVFVLAKWSKERRRIKLREDMGKLANKPFQIIEGYKGRFSLSKWQWFTWTAVIVFSYVAIISSRMLAGNWETGNIDFPSNLWLVMGYSTITVIAAQGIAQHKAKPKPPQNEQGLQTPQAAKTAASDKEDKGKTQEESDLTRVTNLVSDERGNLDLSKIQLIVWTFISIGIYLAMVVNEVNNSSPAVLPDIDTTLMALMGLSSAGYLGKKAISPQNP